MAKHSRLVLALLLFAASTAAWSAGGGSMGTSSFSTPASPEQQAEEAYNQGVRTVERAEGLEADAARQSDAGKQAKLTRKARDAWTLALRKFKRATELVPNLHQGWNYVGYTNRKLGNYDAALSAYDRALALAPGYAQAIEYRGHAYLGLNRLDDAKGAYLQLFAGNRELAARLLSAMQAWVGAQRNAPAGVPGETLEAFASWVSERGAIASQTASLTRAGATSAWH
jgi:tetratricopeptide (TPR) repeat protein